MYLSQCLRESKSYFLSSDVHHDNLIVLSKSIEYINLKVKKNHFFCQNASKFNASTIAHLDADPYKITLCIFSIEKSKKSLLSLGICKLTNSEDQGRG